MAQGEVANEGDKWKFINSSEMFKQEFQEVRCYKLSKNSNEM